MINDKDEERAMDRESGRKDAPRTIFYAEIEAMSKDNINKVFDIPEGMTMTKLGNSHGTYAAFRAQGWTDERTLQHGYIRGKSAALDEVAEEIRKARANWPAFNSAHEGFAVLLEEVDELKSLVWTNQKERDLAAMRKEAMQVAAMAISFMEDVCDEKRGRK